MSNSPFHDLLSFSEASLVWGLKDSTLRKAIEYKKLEPEVDCKKFGRSWVVTKQAMIREYGEPRQKRSQGNVK